MISDITLGQFFPGFSPLHKLDPRTKIVLAVLFIVAVFLVNNPAGFLLMILLTVFMVAVSRISFKIVLRGIRPIIFILIFVYLRSPIHSTVKTGIYRIKALDWIAPIFQII